ncbi:MAG TPA: transporter [Pyrinomonadaceae bacterium]|jgi:hypothetical protein|nr:transporter [Pyrinomonadaceae bacterium]
MIVMLPWQLKQACFAFVVACLASISTHAQLPFYTDDADTTAKGKFHLEFSNEHDWLQKSSFPGKRQNTSVLSLNYGLTNHLELGINAPFIKIFNDRSAMTGSPSGIGDTQFGIKFRLLDEREGSKLPAAALVFYVEVPTGSTRKQIGSGLVDYWLYGVLQKSLTKQTTLRFNGGILFSGNSSTGLIGIESARGQVFTGNGSLVRNFTPRLRLGAEMFGAVTNNFALSRGQLEGQIGGGFALSQNFELTFGVLAGRFAASPRVGAQVGFAYDFK